jgi:hypothetical protein
VRDNCGSSNLKNTKVNLYNTMPISTGQTPDRFVILSSAGDSVLFSFSGLGAGTYYVDIWKDSVSSGNGWEIGDLVGWYGSGTYDDPAYYPINVNAGGTTNISVAVNKIMLSVYGSISSPAGNPLDLGNTKVYLYTSLANWGNYLPAYTALCTGTGPTVTYLFNHIAEGLYYMDVWKDNDNSLAWSSGDYIGWYGTGGFSNITLTPIEITTMSSIQINIEMAIEP